MHQVPVQLRWKDPPPPHRRCAALRRRRQPGPLRRPFPPLLRVATKAPRDVRLGREPAVPAADGGPGRARLRDKRRRPRQPSRGVRCGQQGPPPAAEDPGLPVPEDAAADQPTGHHAVRVHQAVTERSPPPTKKQFPGRRGPRLIADVVGCASGLPSGVARHRCAPAAGAAAPVPRPQRQQTLAMTSSFAAPRVHTHRATCMQAPWRACVVLHVLASFFQHEMGRWARMGNQHKLKARAGEIRFLEWRAA